MLKVEKKEMTQTLRWSLSMDASGLPVAFKLNLRAVKFRDKITYHLYGTQGKTCRLLKQSGGTETSNRRGEKEK